MGVGVRFILKLPLPSTPNKENTNKFQCWGGGRGLAPQTLEGCPSTQDKNRAPYTVEGVLKGKIRQHQSHGRTQHHG